MKIFKEIMSIMCRFANFALGWAIADLFTGDYKSAAWILFVVSIIYLVEHFVLRYGTVDEQKKIFKR